MIFTYIKFQENLEFKLTQPMYEKTLFESSKLKRYFTIIITPDESRK